MSINKAMSLIVEAEEARRLYWETIGEHDRALAEPSEQSIKGWITVVQFVKST